MLTPHLTIPCSELSPNTANPRQVFDEDQLNKLSLSLVRQGQLIPVIVWKIEEKHVILDGERRWRAAQLANIPALNAIVLDHEPDAAELRLMQWTVNTQREALNPVEKAKAIKEIQTLKGWNATQLAESTGLAISTVSMLLSLLTLSASLQLLIEQGKLDISKAYYLSRIDDEAERERLALLAVDGRITRNTLAKLASKTVSPQHESERTPNPKRVSFALPAGYCISITGFDLSLDRILQALSDLTRQARRAQSQGIEATTFSRQLSDQNKPVLTG